MTPFRSFAGAALLLMLAGSQAEAAWNNAFQTCCFGRSHSNRYVPPTVAYSAPNGCCQTNYVQRCYYQPVTTYKTVCEPVTSYRTSYYYEPVCSYRSSCYYDPCTGQSVQVTTPVTSYRLKTQCNAVVNYVQRCVPVTTYRPAYYLEAVTNCAPPPSCCGPTGTAPPAAVTEPPPVGSDGRLIPPTGVPGVDESRSGFPGTGTIRNAPPAPAPAPIFPGTTRLDRVAARPQIGASVTGQVVGKNSIFPISGAKLLFVGNGTQQSATADLRGRFDVTLPAGTWQIYMNRGDGMMEYHSTVDVRDQEARNFRVVSR